LVSDVKMNSRSEGLLSSWRTEDSGSYWITNAGVVFGWKCVYRFCLCGGFWMCLQELQMESTQLFFTCLFVLCSKRQIMLLAHYDHVLLFSADHVNLQASSSKRVHHLRCGISLARYADHS
jgi:hypothetical protein